MKEGANEADLELVMTHKGRRFIEAEYEKHAAMEASAGGPMSRKLAGQLASTGYKGSGPTQRFVPPAKKAAAAQKVARAKNERIKEAEAEMMREKTKKHQKKKLEEKYAKEKYALQLDFVKKFKAIDGKAGDDDDDDSSRYF